MGELSKLTGELGENIVENFIQLVGWSEPITPLDIECVYPVRHRSDGAQRDRKSHGIGAVSF